MGPGKRDHSWPRSAGFERKTSAHVKGLAVGDSEPKVETALSVWLVSYGETDDREMRPPQIAEALRRGEIGEETIVWREGLAEWVALGTVSELAKLLPSSGLTASAPAKPLVSSKPPVPSQHETTAGNRVAAAEPGEPVSIDPESVPASSSEGGFGRVEALSAGTLTVVERKALPAPPPAPEREVVPEIGPEAEEASSPSSGTPSLHTLAAPIRPMPRPVDDEIMNLGVHPPGHFGPSTIGLSLPLAAPEHTPMEDAATAPIARTAEPEPEATPTDTAVDASPSMHVPASKRSSLPWLAVAAIAVAVPVLALRRTPETAVESGSKQETIVPTSPATPQPTIASGAASAAPFAAPAGASSARVAIGGAVASATPQGTFVVAPATPPTNQVVNSDEPKQKSETATVTPSSKMEATAAPMTAETPPRADEAQSEGPAFDAAAVQAALGAAAAQAARCRKEGDPMGTAIVRVTFSNSGNVTRAVVEGLPFAGTETGSCVAAALQRAKVPAYSGDRVTVTKRVVVQ